MARAKRLASAAGRAIITAKVRQALFPSSGPFAIFQCGQVRNLTPLEGMKLSAIRLPDAVDLGMSVLRRMKTLEKIHVGTALSAEADFWKQYDAGKFPQFKD